MTRRLLVLALWLICGLIVAAEPVFARDCGGNKSAKTGNPTGFSAASVNIPELDRLIKDLETAPPEDRARIEGLVRDILQLKPDRANKNVPDGYFEYNGRRYRLRC